MRSSSVTAVDYGDQTEDLEYSGAPATVGGFKLRSRKQPKRQATVYESDATCLPPIMVGRQRTLVLCFDGTGAFLSARRRVGRALLFRR